MANIQSAGKTVFTFPGQGSFNGGILRELYSNPCFRAEFTVASEIAGRILGQPLLPLASASNDQECDRVLSACPELDQLAIYLTNYLVASQLISSGLRPELVVGHSFGELAALAIAGVYSFEIGAKIVCQRTALLRQVTSGGKMAAVSCGSARALEIVRSLGATSLEVAVINNDRQTVISGLPADLDRMASAAAGLGVGLTVLKSRYPFHSSLLTPAVESFRLALCSYEFQVPEIPVYLCTERTMYSDSVDLAKALSDQFFKQLDFAAILKELHSRGFRNFVECGAGNIVTKVTQASGLEGVHAYSSAHLADGVKKGSAAVLHQLEVDLNAHQPDRVVMKLAKDMREVLTRAARVIDGAGEHHLVPALAATGVPTLPETEPEPMPEVESCEADPIAIVSVGCILPGAHSPEQYWKNIMTGVSGITDLGLEDATAILDFKGGSAGAEQKIVSDKTYTLLSGNAGTITYDAKLLTPSYSEAAFNRLTRAEKLLAIASAQALGGLRAALATVPADRIECVLGATADGSAEYDYSVFEGSMEETLARVEPEAGRRVAFISAMKRIWGEPKADNPRASQSESCRAVIEASAGRPIRTYIIDAACSSSLYAIGLGVTALQDRTKDVMLVGGVFAPALANSALFAQFRGLSPSGSRPLDASADGVIFGEGSGLLVLKRLSDAIASGERVLGVVRGVGVSSDGKSPAINVPQSKGQSIAIRRAYQDSRIDPNTIQYVEAHATATPVGDAVEFGALRQAITRDSSLPRIELGSVKALIGHTGWAAGAASVIKLCKAFEARTVPPQFNYSSPNAEINLQDSPFRISTTAAPWPVNIGFLPRRAAINGFGFGGTNAHLILEEFHPAYHRQLCANVAPIAPQEITLAVIDATALFPSDAGFENTKPGGLREFPRAFLRLPKGKRLLPDVTEHMDPGQTLALLAAEKVLPALGDRLKDLRGETGIVIGVESKTERGIRANQRIFLDRLQRRFSEDSQSDGIPADTRNSILDQVATAVRAEVIPSGPYTLPGLMPNVISGRVANMFELNGPNVVIDMGRNSLFQSIMVARDFLAHGECKAVLAGGLNAVCMSPDEAEAAFLMVLTTEATARELSLPVSCLLTVGESRPTVGTVARKGLSYRGAEGVVELSDAIAKAKDGGEVAVRECISDPALTRELIFRSARPVVVATPAKKTKEEETAPASSTYAYVQGTPIYYYTPVETAAALPAASLSRSGSKILFLTDQPGHWRQLEKSGALAGLDYHVLCTLEASLSQSTRIDVMSEENVKSGLAGVQFPFNTVVPVKFLADGAPDSLLTASGDGAAGLMDLCFAVCRQSYEALQAGSIAVGSLCLGAFINVSAGTARLNPFTGLLGGFVKSLARELPAAVCRSLNVSEPDFRHGFALLQSELSHRDPAVEICYRSGERFVIELAKMERASSGEAPLLDASSVVLATGGGRGVTAVLTEELLNRFGCTVIAVGRTNPALVPAEILAMNPDQLAAYEPEFYKTEMAKGGRKITQLRDAFRTYQAAHEVHWIIRSLSALPGQFEYISADITNGEATTAIVESVFRKYGRLDLVLHGAGTQISKVIPRKTVADFRSVVAAKMSSLQHIYQTCQRLRGDRAVHYHLLTSAFSYMGNDGQPDYGAVNESLNRLADVMHVAPDTRQLKSGWASVAWLGWAGIGMTRGSEFAALAANRGLRGITKSEGQEIFSHFVVGEPTAPINILMADGELKFYDVVTNPGFYKPVRHVPSITTRRDSLSIERTVTADGSPYILNHCVDGIPTLPGAYLIMMVAEAALELRPDLKITAFEDAAFRRFVRLRSDGPTKLRLNASIVNENDRNSLIRVQVVSDFVHKSGKLLQKDVVQTELSVRMHPSLDRSGSANGLDQPRGRVLSDPYVMKGSPVHLNGVFRTLNNIVVGESSRSAEYRLSEKITGGVEGPGFLSNLLVMDSLWRFGAIDMDAHNTLPVYVPEACKVMKVYYDLGNPREASALATELSMIGFNPTADQDKLTIGPVEVRDSAGSVLLTVDGGICRRLGEVRHSG